MTLRKFNKLYTHYKTYYDLEVKKITFEQINKAIAKDDEWF